MEQITAHSILRSGQWLKADSRVILGYDARFLRRKRLQAEDGSSFLVDLGETTSLDHG
ncbi:MAG: urease accessory protein UreE, partial [Gemmobacter sp.]